jgi:hypothetical protein
LPLMSWAVGCSQCDERNVITDVRGCGGDERGSEQGAHVSVAAP